MSPSLVIIAVQVPFERDLYFSLRSAIADDAKETAEQEEFGWAWLGFSGWIGQYEQTSDGSFSAVTKPNFASKYWYAF